MCSCQINEYLSEYFLYEYELIFLNEQITNIHTIRAILFSLTTHFESML